MNRGDAAVITVMIIFGLTFIAIKIALAEAGPLFIAFSRFFIASIILLPLAGSPRGLPIKHILLLGFTGVAAFFTLQNFGLVYTTASNASLILASIPAITAILSRIFLKESLSRAKLIAISLSIAGVVLIVFAGGGIGRSSSGDLLVLGSAFSWSVYTILGKKMQGYPSLRATTYTMVSGAILLFPPALWEFRLYPVSSILLPTIISIFFLGAVASAGAFFLYNWALKYIEAGRAALYTNLPPVVTVTAGVLYLGEPLYPLQIAGGILVLLGIGVYNKK